MQSRLDKVSEELQKLKLQGQFDSKRIRELNAEKATLTTRMKDQDEELKGKAQLLEVCPYLLPDFRREERAQIPIGRS